MKTHIRTTFTMGILEYLTLFPDSSVYVLNRHKHDLIQLIVKWMKLGSTSWIGVKTHKRSPFFMRIPECLTLLADSTVYAFHGHNRYLSYLVVKIMKFLSTSRIRVKTCIPNPFFMRIPENVTLFTYSTFGPYTAGYTIWANLWSKEWNFGQHLGLAWKPTYPHHLPWGF